MSIRPSYPASLLKVRLKSLQTQAVQQGGGILEIQVSGILAQERR